jgi:membrane protein required for colicin V production
MTALDLAIIGIVVISSIISLFRGFLKEVISLIFWLLAFVLGFKLSPLFSQMLPDSISDPITRVVVAGVILFVLTLLIGGLVNFLVQHFVEMAGLSWPNRVLGGAFGLLRGLVIVTVLVMAAGLSPLPRQPIWLGSALVAPFVDIAVQMRDTLPPSVRGYFVFS